MSNWAHVCGCIRVDTVNFFKPMTVKDLEKILGKEITFEELLNNPTPKTNMPYGSEGSLQYQIWQNPNGNSVAQFTISVWGDLRSVDDPTQVINWFTDIISGRGLIIRQAILEVSINLEQTTILCVKDEKVYTLNGEKVFGGEE